MGVALNSYGKYIGWSNLFNYSTLESLNASEKLPLPKGRKLELSENGVDLSNEIQAYNSTSDPNERLDIVRQALEKLGDSSTIKNTEGNESLLKALQTHEDTKLNPNEREDAIKNLVSFNVQRVVEDVRNILSAYTPVDVDNIREASTLGNNEGMDTLTGLDPSSKLIMQFQNMVGKKVISVAANGEKVFFTLSNYFNEGLRSNDPNFRSRLNFRQTYNRIQNRASGQAVPYTATMLNNVNFATEALTYYYNKYGITDPDNQLDRVQIATKECEEYLKHALNEETDQNISQLLSAATDFCSNKFLLRNNLVV